MDDLNFWKFVSWVCILLGAAGWLFGAWLTATGRDPKRPPRPSSETHEWVNGRWMPKS